MGNGNLGSFEGSFEGNLSGEGYRLPGGFCPPWPFKCRPLTTEEYRERDIEAGHGMTQEEKDAAERSGTQYQEFQRRQRESQERREQNERERAASGGRKKITAVALLGVAAAIGGGVYYFKVVKNA
jgi:hypothetical protein